MGAILSVRLISTVHLLRLCSFIIINLAPSPFLPTFFLPKPLIQRACLTAERYIVQNSHHHGEENVAQLQHRSFLTGCPSCFLILRGQFAL